MEHRIYFNMLLPTRQWLLDESADSIGGALRTDILSIGCSKAASSAMDAASSGLYITVPPTWSTSFIPICCCRRGSVCWIESRTQSAALSAPMQQPRRSSPRRAASTLRCLQRGAPALFQYVAADEAVSIRLCRRDKFNGAVRVAFHYNGCSNAAVSAKLIAAVSNVEDQQFIDSQRHHDGRRLRLSSHHSSCSMATARRSSSQRAASLFAAVSNVEYSSLSIRSCTDDAAPIWNGLRVQSIEDDVSSSSW